MFANLLKPKVDFAALMLRLGLAAIFIVHGSLKIVQDRPLIPKEMSMAVQTLVGWTEFSAGILLAIGLLSRLAALATIVPQVAAIVLVTGKRALAGPSFEAFGVDYMKVGPEYNLVLIVMAISVIALGSGVYSLDHCLLTLLRRKRTTEVPQSVAVNV